MYLLQIWFTLSDPAAEDAVYDSHAMRKFTGINFMTEAVLDETPLCKFRHFLKENSLNKQFFDAINRVVHTMTVTAANEHNTISHRPRTCSGKTTRSYTEIPAILESRDAPKSQMTSIFKD